MNLKFKKRMGRGRNNAELNRRKFLTYVGTGAAALTVASAGLGGLAPKVEAKGADAANKLFGFNKKVSGLNFKAIDPSDKDDLVLPKGYKYDVVAAYGDKINEGEIHLVSTMTSLCIFQLTDQVIVDYFG